VTNSSIDQIEIHFMIMEPPSPLLNDTHRFFVQFMMQQRIEKENKCIEVYKFLHRKYFAGKNLSIISVSHIKERHFQIIGK
jgi:hypothetical protein